MRKQFVFGLGMLVVSLLVSQRILTDKVIAGGPSLVTRNGESFRWRVDPIPYTPDQGPLGRFSNATAMQLLAEALKTWGSVPTTVIRFRQEGQLGIDVTGDNYMDFVETLPRNVNPIIFDTDGSIIDAVVGAGARADVIGFTTLNRLQPPVASRGEYKQGLVVFNGLFATLYQDSTEHVPTEMILAVMIHEFGHLTGLDHTALGADQAFDLVPENDIEVPTMFSFLVSRSQVKLHPDDSAAISTLYPSPSFAVSTGTIQGRILMPNGTTGFQGANVIARRFGIPMSEISAFSGDLYAGNRRPAQSNGSMNPTFRGFYKIAGLPPGQYTVEVRQVSPFLTGGSGAGPLDPPSPFIFRPELFSGSHESNHDAFGPGALVTVKAGEKVEDINIILDGDPPDNDSCAQAMPITNLPFDDRRDTRFSAGEDNDPQHSCTTLRQDSNSVWYSFTPDDSGVVKANTFGSNYNTVISAYIGECGGLVEMTCNNDAGDGVTQSQAVWGVIKNRTYLLEVTDSDNQIGGGNLHLSVDFTPGALVPEQEPNELLNQAQRLGHPGAVLGDIALGDPGTVVVSLSGRMERMEDVYRFHLDCSRNVQINLSGEKVGTPVEMVLFSVNGTETTVMAQGSQGRSSSIGPIHLHPGSYFIGLSVSDAVTTGSPTQYILAMN